MTLASLTTAYSKALETDDLETITEIVAAINNLPPSQKTSYLDLYIKIEDDLFQKDLSVTNLNLPQYKDEIKNWENRSTQKTTKVSDEKIKLSGNEQFDVSFVEFYNRNFEVLSELKDFYLLKLTNPEINEVPATLVLCDDASSNFPILKKIQKSETDAGTNCEKLLISKYLESVSAVSGPNLNYVCILCINPNLKGISDIKEQLVTLMDHFEFVSLIKVRIRNSSITISDYEENRSKESILTHIEENSNKVFNNRILSYDQERIVKDFFSGITAVLNYRVLNPGASGSSVIEVQYSPTYMATSKRFVIKIAKKEPGRKAKLKEEMKNYNSFVSGVSTKNTYYQAEYLENEVFEAIKYSYASSGSVVDALSFAEILGTYFNPKADSKFPDINTITLALFNCELITAWNQTAPLTKKCKDLYEPFLRKEEEIKQTIRDINDETVDSEGLIKFYDVVKQLDLECNEKPCHGDLHSDNFFWDASHVTLIDFGITGIHHAVVDHSSLETSIRVKHFPRHLPLKELMNYESQFIDNKTFDGSLDLAFIPRDPLRNLFASIMLIRKDAVQYLRNPQSTFEYQISLFLLMFRQIQYRDLNQLYALRMADLLAKKIKLP